MFRILLFPVLLAAAGALVPGPYAYAEGLGATCWARPYSANRYDHTSNMCQVVGETQFPGPINSLGAKPNIIKMCIEKNALDYGCDHEGGCCATQCERVAVCLYLTPNKSIEKSQDLL